MLLAASSGEAAALDVFLVGEDDITPTQLMGWATPLRKAGLRVGFELDRRSVKAQFRAATRSRARYVGVVNGERMEMRSAGRRLVLALGEVGEWGRRAVVEDGAG